MEQRCKLVKIGALQICTKQNYVQDDRTRLNRDQLSLSESEASPKSHQLESNSQVCQKNSDV